MPRLALLVHALSQDAINVSLSIFLLLFRLVKEGSTILEKYSKVYTKSYEHVAVRGSQQKALQHVYKSVCHTD